MVFEITCEGYDERNKLLARFAKLGVYNAGYEKIPGTLNTVVCAKDDRGVFDIMREVLRDPVEVQDLLYALEGLMQSAENWGALLEGTEGPNNVANARCAQARRTMARYGPGAKEGGDAD